MKVEYVWVLLAAAFFVLQARDAVTSYREYELMQDRIAYIKEITNVSRDMNISTMSDMAKTLEKQRNDLQALTVYLARMQGDQVK